MVTTGPAGPQGEVGPQGEAGPAGATGPQGPAGTAGSGTDSQTLTASALSSANTLTLAISDGNTVTLDLSALAGGGSSTDSQTLNASALSAGSTLTLAISDGNTVTLDLSSLAVTADSDNDTKIQVEEASDDDTIRFDTAGIERMVISPSGYVGISKDSGLLAPLSVNVSSTVTEARLLDLISNNHRYLSLLQPNTTLNSDPFTWSTPNAIQWRVDAIDAMIVNASGNVGIGTTSPVQTLTVDGSARITEHFYDSFNAAGTSGQVLSSTGTGTNWIDFSLDKLVDADSDTQIQVQVVG